MLLAKKNCYYVSETHENDIIKSPKKTKIVDVGLLIQEGIPPQKKAENNKIMINKVLHK